MTPQRKLSEVEMRLRSGLGAVATVVAALLPAQAQQPEHRPPAVPLVVNDPYFSIWSMSDHLTDTPTKHWSEAAKPLIGLARIDEHVVRWVGAAARGNAGLRGVEAVQQLSLQITPLHTRYAFSAEGMRLEVAVSSRRVANARRRSCGHNSAMPAACARWETMRATGGNVPLPTPGTVLWICMPTVYRERSDFGDISSRIFGNRPKLQAGWRRH
jgi:Domain of unknown function (DUF4964)